MKLVRIAGFKIRVFEEDGQLLFASTDVGKMLGVADSSSLWRRSAAERQYRTSPTGKELRVLTKVELFKAVFGATHKDAPRERREYKEAAQAALMNQAVFTPFEDLA